ncbi:hypothetical protein [uncultured Nostoc sp.]|uniref:hypothetical protein n=1 Tax=uncultured Nostoc sp. TaxID=340711 RepID=UPI0035C94866
MNFSPSGVDWLEERNPTFQDFVEFHDLQHGVEVKRRIFDNLSTEALTKENWLNDFQCPGRYFLIDYLDEL